MVLNHFVKNKFQHLDYLESGTKTYATANIQTIDYKVKELLTAMSFRNTAYVYTKQEDDPACNLILYAMCQQYPSPLFGGVDHVKIPADGDDIYLVVLAMGRVGVSNDNSLFAETEQVPVVGLPAVVSQCDLIYPALSGNVDGEGVREKTILSKESAVMLGRFHQMACLVLFKDIDTSGILQMYMEEQMSSGILQMSNGMDWLKYIDDESMERLRKYSVFEGFWLVKSDPDKALKDGVIRCLKRGVNDQTSIRIPGLNTDGSFDVLKEEVILGGGDSELQFAEGAFSLKLACIERIEGPRKIISFSQEGTSSFI
ncbi:hypothetical protein Bca4012_031204 [Brassica carinata]